MSEVYYQWISNGGCEICDALEGVHPDAPQRPHPNCLCTILRIDPSSLPGFCLWDEPLVVEVRSGWNEITYNHEQNLYDHLVMEFIFTVLCRDGTIVEGTWRYEDEDPSLPFSGGDDEWAWIQLVVDKAEEAAAEYAEEYCPECKEPEAAPEGV